MPGTTSAAIQILTSKITHATSGAGFPPGVATACTLGPTLFLVADYILDTLGAKSSDNPRASERSPPYCGRRLGLTVRVRMRSRRRSKSHPGMHSSTANTD